MGKNLELDQELMGELARQMRVEAGFTQGDAARGLEISQSYLSQIESGQRRARGPLARRLADFYARATIARSNPPAEPADDFDRGLVLMTKNIGSVIRALELFPQTPAVIRAAQRAVNLLLDLGEIGREKYEPPKGRSN